MTEPGAVRDLNGAIHAFVDWETNPAARPGPLSGLTVGIKANISVAGLPWTAGMALHRKRIAATDASVVSRLRCRGATILGMLNMDEAAFGATGTNPVFGTTRNPLCLDCTPGGSSGGSAAAVAAGLCDVALGTDTLGSIRIPAAYCGVYGLKPSHGAIPLEGMEILDPALDCIGPLAAKLCTLKKVWRIMADTPAPAHAQPFTKALYLESLAGITVEPGVAARWEKVLAALPIETLAMRPPAGLDHLRRTAFIQAGRKLIDALGTHWRDDHAALSAELRARLLWCSDKNPDRALLQRTREDLRALLGDESVLVMPTTPQTAFPLKSAAPVNQAAFTCLASIAGLPALALPAGRDPEGMPVGIQIVGPEGSEERLFALAEILSDRLS